MTNAIIKSTLIFLAILLTGVNAEAQSVPLPVGTKLQIQTSQIGGTIAGLSADGKFFGIVCGSGKDSADLLFQNGDGDVRIERYNSSTPSVSAWTPSRSPYIGLSTAAATQVCNNPNGNYVFEIGSEDKTMKLNVASFQPDTRDRKTFVPTEGRMQVRTGQVGKKIVAVTNDARFFAIVCTSGMVWSSADMIYANKYGNIIIKDYNAEHIRHSPPASEIAAYMPMTSKAMTKVCNFPNGIYTLDVVQKDASTEVEFVGGESFEANARVGRGRGF